MGEGAVGSFRQKRVRGKSKKWRFRGAARDLGLKRWLRFAAAERGHSGTNARNLKFERRGAERFPQKNSAIQPRPGCTGSPWEGGLGSQAHIKRRRIRMLKTMMISIVVLLPALARAEGPVKLYYVGEAKVSSASGEPMGSQVYLLEKTLDREKATITERAVIIRPGEAAEEWTLRFAVKEDNTFTLSE